MNHIQVRQGQQHVPVMLRQVLEALHLEKDDTCVDATFGAGGYSQAILDRFSNSNVIAFDQDPDVIRGAGHLFDAFPNRIRVIESNFSKMAEYIGEKSVQAVVMDIGVSSMQIDQKDRGFSFLGDGPLDMRMNQKGPTAADFVNCLDAKNLSKIFRIYAEEKQAVAIARAISKRVEKRPIGSTLELAQLIVETVGTRYEKRIHPATRVFQALRMAVNRELASLFEGLRAAEHILAENGRLIVVTFHSVEDRLVKQFLKERCGALQVTSRHLPPAKSIKPSFELLFTKALKPDEREILENPRARSAKLRAAVRTDNPVLKPYQLPAILEFEPEKSLQHGHKKHRKSS